MRHPLADGHVLVHCTYDVDAFCAAVLRGDEPDLQRGPVTYEIRHRRPADLSTWLLETVRDRAVSTLAEVTTARSTLADGTGHVAGRETGP